MQYNPISGRWWGKLVVVASLLTMLACAEEENKAPRLQPIDDQIFRINQANTLNVASTDPDGDPRSYSFVIDPEPDALGSGSITKL